MFLEATSDVVPMSPPRLGSLFFVVHAQGMIYTTLQIFLSTFLVLSKMAQQRTHAWHTERRGRLTASNLGYLVGQGSDLCSSPQAYKKIGGTGQYKDSCTVPALHWGTVNEPNAIMEYMRVTGNLVEATGFKVHPVINWLGGSPDGLVGNDGMIEAKCPFYKKRDGSSRLHDEVKRNYYCQINALLEVFDRQWCDYVVWTPNEGMRIMRVYRDRELFDFLLGHYSQIYACFASGASELFKLTTVKKKEITDRIAASTASVDLTMWDYALSTHLGAPPSLSDVMDGDNEDEALHRGPVSEEGGRQGVTCDREESVPGEGDRKRYREEEHVSHKETLHEVCHTEIHVQGYVCEV